MPRNSSGTYALPAGNPVSPNTIIETAWANPTMADIGSALTDSLDRFGRGSMLAPIKAPDGTASAPVYSFVSEATLGIYRPASQQIGFAVNGTTPLTVTATGITATAATITTATITTATIATITGAVTIGGALTLSAALFTPLGTVGAPTHSFVGDTNTGMWSPGADILAWSTGGAEKARITSATQAELLVGTTSAFSGFAGRGNVSVNGTSAAIVAVGTAGAINGYLFTDGTNVAVRSATGSGLLTLGAAGNDYATISAAGNFGIGGTPNAYPNRTALTLNNATGTIFDQNIAGVRTSTIAVDGTAIIFGGLTALPLIFWTNSAEKARITSAAQSEFLVGTTSATYSSSGRGLVEINGSAEALIAFKKGGTAQAYIQSDSSGAFFINNLTNTALTFSTNGSGRLVIANDGRIYGANLHNNAGAVTGTTNQYIASGTYTPTLTNTANVSASTANLTCWMRVGNVVTVAGIVLIDPVNASTLTQINISLPIASNFSTGFEAGGSCGRNATGPMAAIIGADIVNHNVSLSYQNDTDTANRSWAFVFQYVIV